MKVEQKSCQPNQEEKNLESTSSCHTISMDIPDFLPPTFSFVHRFRQVLKVTSQPYFEDTSKSTLRQAEFKKMVSNLLFLLHCHLKMHE